MSESDKPKAVARVRFTVEFSDCGTWGKDCPLGQVWHQAQDAALRAFESMLQEAGKAGLRFAIVGKPEVFAVVVPEAKP